MAFAVRAARAAFAFLVKFAGFVDRPRAAVARPDRRPVTGHDGLAVRLDHPVTGSSVGGHPLAMALRATGAA